MIMAFKARASRSINVAYAFLGRLLIELGHRPGRIIFIIGTGRCGTSLLVRILESHEQLIGFPGEANDLWHPKSYPFSARSVETPTIIEDPKRFSEISMSSWSDTHGQVIRRAFTAYHFVKGSSKTLFVKSAMLSFIISRILSIFPDARFIHIYRNGPSVVESLVQKNWSKSSVRYRSKSEYRLHCAKYWNDCIMEIERKKTELSLDKRSVLMEFSYESLCEAPNVILVDIAEFLGIASSGFTYDVSRIFSRNYKVGDYVENDKWHKLLQVMAQGMQLKGYL